MKIFPGLPTQEITTIFGPDLRELRFGPDHHLTANDIFLLNYILSRYIIDDVMYWTGRNKPMVSQYRYYYYRSSAEVEMTAYALLAILHEHDDANSVVTDEAMDIVRWLSKQRNSYGGFASTQVRALQVCVIACISSFK